MTEAATKPPDDVADPAAAAPTGAAASPATPAGDGVDDLLAEYDRATAPQPQPAQSADQPSPATGDAPKDEIDALLDELSKPAVSSPLFTHGADAHQQLQAQEQFGQLQNENAALRLHAQRQADQADLDRLTGELQSRLPHLPSDYAAAALKSMALDHPELVLAFDARHVDRRAMDQELRRVEQTLAQLQRNPNGADPQQVAQLRQYGWQLGVALNSREILRRAVREVEKRGQAFKPIDEQATADHDAVVWAVKGASGKTPVEPPPNLGGLSDKAFARYTKENFGF